MRPGDRFGRYTLVRRAGRNRWECRCDCGNVRICWSGNLSSGRGKSCGCLHAEICSASFATHGEARPGKQSPEYRAWTGLKTRCYNPRSKSWGRYGGSGIVMCDRWRLSYQAFLVDMGRRPSPRHSIDRIDGRGNYEPGNCRWATPAQQRRNQSRTVLTDAEAAQIRGFLELGWPHRNIADIFGTCEATISHIYTGRQWRTEAA